MPSPIVIVHGWSDGYKSFVNLARFLRDRLKRSVTTIDLADWVSLDDEITYRDLRHAMQRAWTNHPAIRNRKNVHLISHSTGALVVRDWMTTYYTPETVPVKRHVMLAPANFGSQLAHKGRTWLGRAFKGWRTGFETGTHLLRGLELASPYTRELAERDLFGGKRWYGPDRVMAAVLVGNSGYGGAATITDEVGGDGTVRVSTANLDAARLAVDYTVDADRPRLTLRRPPGKSALAFGVSDGDDHGSIAFKKKNTPRGPHAAGWLEAALTVPRTRWSSFVDELALASRRLYEPGSDDPYFHGYQNTEVSVRDDLDNPVEEFLVEFHRNRRGRFSADHFSAFFQRNVINDVHNYTADPSCRSFYLDIDLLRGRVGEKPLFLELEALPRFRRGNAVGYGSLGKIPLNPTEVEKYFVRNRTLLVDVRIPRIVGPNAFKLEPSD